MLKQFQKLKQTGLVTNLKLKSKIIITKINNESCFKDQTHHLESFGAHCKLCLCLFSVELLK